MTQRLGAESVKPSNTGYGVVLAAAVIGGSLCVALPIPGMDIAVVSAQAPIPPQLGVFPEGEITAVGSSTLDVAGIMYALHPKLTIVSDKGEAMELRQLRPGLVIQYHVKEGALDRIIVLIPR
jgi:hypothetical protein